MRDFLFMQVSKETIQEFREIYKRKEGKELSNKEALEIATNLLLVFDAIYRPILKKEKIIKDFKNGTATICKKVEPLAK